MRTITHFLVGLCVLLALSLAASAWWMKSSISLPDDVRAAGTMDIAGFLTSERPLPGISIATFVAGRPKSHRAFGVVDTSTSEPIDENTLFEAASLTKPVIAAIAMRLYDQGAYDLDEPVMAVVEAPRITDRKAYAATTPRHLLAHTSGLPNWAGDSRDPDRTDALEFKFLPGTDFSYSGEGYGILLDFLEAKSGRSMSDLSTELFTELGMGHSTLTAAQFEGVYARGHWGAAPGRQAWRTDHIIAAYSLFTTARDYATFMAFQMDGGGVSPDTLAEFRRRHATIKTGADASGAPYTLGWSLGWGTLQRPDDTLYFQWGDNGAFKALAAFEPEKGNGIVYLSNGSYANLYADDLAREPLGDMSGATGWFSNPWLELARRFVKS